MASDRLRGNGLRLHQGRLRDQEEFLHGDGGQAMKRAAQGTGGVNIPEGIEEMCGHGTKGRGLAVDL